MLAMGVTAHSTPISRLVEECWGREGALRMPNVTLSHFKSSGAFSGVQCLEAW